jgi:hypothetical protein
VTRSQRRDRYAQGCGWRARRNHARDANRSLVSFKPLNLPFILFHLGLSAAQTSIIYERGFRTFFVGWNWGILGGDCQPVAQNTWGHEGWYDNVFNSKFSGLACYYRRIILTGAAI